MGASRVSERPPVRALWPGTEAPPSVDDRSRPAPTREAARMKSGNNSRQLAEAQRFVVASRRPHRIAPIRRRENLYRLGEIFNRFHRVPAWSGQSMIHFMDGLGRRLRERVRELGMSDAEVARRAGLTQARYSNYVHERHEPDLGAFARICAALGVSAGALLGQGADDAFAELRDRVGAAMLALDGDSLRVLAVVADGLVARRHGAPD